MKKAVLIDLDGTILKDRELTSYAILKTLSFIKTKVNIEISFQSWNNALAEYSTRNWLNSPLNNSSNSFDHDEMEGLWANYDRSDDATIQLLRLWAPRYRLKTWAQVLEKFGIDNESLAAECSEQFIKHRRKYTLYPETIDALTALKSEFKLGLVTNGISVLQRQKIKVSNIQAYFDSIAISEEIGSQKPNREIFNYICGELNVYPSECVMIGDDSRKDIGGAKAAGMYAVLIKRHENMNNEIICEEADVVCGNLIHAAEWILREKEGE